MDENVAKWSRDQRKIEDLQDKISFLRGQILVATGEIKVNHPAEAMNALGKALAVDETLEKITS